jgi:DNA-binding Lrp family transcriptional regulator
MAIKITPQQRRILAEVTWNARTPVEAVARTLRVKAHTVRHALRQLHNAFEFTPVCWTHPYLLGEIPFRTFFRITGGSPQRVREFEKFIGSIPQVSWFVSLIGSYQYSVTIRAKGHLDFLEIADRIDARFGDIITDKSVSSIVQLSCFEPRFVESGSGPRKSFDYVATSDRLELSALDHGILTFLRDKPLASMQEIGRGVNASATTVDYRFNRLITLGAIMGFAYSYDWSHIGDSEFLVSLSTKGLGSRCYDKIFTFCAQHANVMWLGRFIGHWDVELALSVHQASELEAFVQELHSTFRDEVAEIHIHTFGRLHRDR